MSPTSSILPEVANEVVVESRSSTISNEQAAFIRGRQTLDEF